ncbi:hypothetical protein N7504_004230 [Penicillium tannophilum]|nr:hypothetical protein N7504_004230 [Penicillium tannophilum]
MRCCLFALVALSLGVNAMPHAPRVVRKSTSVGGQKPFSFPLANGFPNIAQGSDALTEIEKQAHGTLPNGASPTEIADNSVAVWQLIAFNELFEVAYFSNLIENITDGISGYELASPAARNVITTALEAVRAQEEIHALGANGILQAAGRDPISPCEYIFPVDDLDSAINFASVFTDIVLGTLQEALKVFGSDGDAVFLGLVGSVIGQEGEQNGFYRTVDKSALPPSTQPLLTASSGPFLLSALYQTVIVPGSCPDSLPIPVFGALDVDTSYIKAQTQELEFSFYTNETTVSTEGLSLVYINGQNTPVVEKLSNVRLVDDYVHFTATFPYQEYVMDGLTIAAVTNSVGPFSDASDVAAATLYGPGIIELA